MKQRVTSFRPAPPPSTSLSPNEPGSQATLISEIFTEDGEELIGIGSWARDVVVSQRGDASTKGKKNGLRRPASPHPSPSPLPPTQHNKQNPSPSSPSLEPRTT
jgi:hypothetical protein